MSLDPRVPNPESRRLRQGCGGPPKLHAKAGTPNPASRTPTVADLGERELIARIRARVPSPPPSVVVGIGDDAAVVEPERNALDVITTDALVEGVHFDRAIMPAAAIGHRALAVNLSDLAAMGARPRLALLSLALPPALPAADVDDLIEGLLALAARFRVSLVGGNITRSPGPLIVDVTAIGAVKRRRVLSRVGARPGDELYVSGTLGGAAAGLQSLRAAASLSGAIDGARHRALGCEARYQRPEPRVRLGSQVASHRAARACLDLSDGLADGVRQLAAASDAGATVCADEIPLDEETRAWFAGRGLDPAEAAAGESDDYELLFAVAPNDRRRLAAARRLSGDVPLTRIGVITADRAIVWRQGGAERELPPGYAHFG